MIEAFMLIIHRRTRVAIFFAFLLAMILLGRLYERQILNQAAFAQKEERATTLAIQWKPSRGLILDRNHRELVWNVDFYSVVALPQQIKNATESMWFIANYLGISYQKLLKQINEVQWKNANAGKDGKKIIEIALQRDLDSSKIQKIENLKIAGIRIRKEEKRYYPKKTLAGQVIGYANLNNEGLAGVEIKENTRLSSFTIPIRTQRYGDRGHILEKDYLRDVPPRGADVVLTLDETIQWYTEKALASYCEAYSCRAGMAVIMDPWNGEILAMANYPFFDPGQYSKYPSSESNLRVANHCILDPYEPGSTIKPLIVAAALEKGVITPETLINCENGKRYLPSKYRKTPITDEHRMGAVPVTEVLVFSSNIGVGKIAEMMVRNPDGTVDYHNLEKALNGFGFGRKTGIELPGEERMRLTPSHKWNLNDLLVTSFGTGHVMATPIGMAQAYAILANGGIKVRPRILKGYISNTTGKFYENEPVYEGRVISEKTAQAVREMLAQVVTRGTGKKGASPWYSSAGKTGTALKVVNKVYSRQHRLLSFAGFAPAVNPRIVVVAMLDEPQGVRFGGQAAAPLFRQIFEDTLAYLQVPPDQIPDKPVEPPKPDFDSPPLPNPDNDDSKMEENYRVTSIPENEQGSTEFQLIQSVVNREIVETREQ